MRALLTDIEGTTTPVSFVNEVLFPFAAERLQEACAGAAASSAMAAAVARLRREYRQETTAGVELPAFGSGAPYARYLMERDRKSPGLKALQGLIWRQGYGRGDLKGIVFPDVPPALRAWQRRGLRLRVYSSGSILAQKLLFSTTEYGDLSDLFEGFHDTGTGPKLAADSYRAIAAAYGIAAGEVLFLSDVLGELDAAATAGMATGLLDRPGNKPVQSNSHPRYREFGEIPF